MLWNCTHKNSSMPETAVLICISFPKCFTNIKPFLPLQELCSKTCPKTLLLFYLNLFVLRCSVRMLTTGGGDFWIVLSTIVRFVHEEIFSDILKISFSWIGLYCMIITIIWLYNECKLYNTHHKNLRILAKIYPTLFLQNLSYKNLKIFRRIKEIMYNNFPAHSESSIKNTIISWQ